MTSLNQDRPLRAVLLHARLALLALLVLPSTAFAAKLGEPCGQRGSWSARCDGSLQCEVEPGQTGRVGVCVEAPRRCGGLLGAQCGAGEYCDFPIDALCGAADQTGICKPQPQACTFDNRPVCGCDDRTYPNACAANAAGVSVSASGACETCNIDDQCPHGFCEHRVAVVCRRASCPPAPPGQCVSCGDGSQLRCRRAELPCPTGQVREIVDGCYGECVDRQTCEAPAAPAKPPSTPPATACRVGGCSGQLCTSAAGGGVISTCEWRAEYACYRGATCAVQPSGQCGWTPTAALRSCLGSGAR